MEPEALADHLRANLDGVVHVEVKDLTGTKDHFEALIVAEAFASKSRIEQHQLVYGALGELMHGPIHALALKTMAPDAWSDKA